MVNENKEVKIVPPEGYEIDKENSTFECIKFKPVEKTRFSDYDGKYLLKGYYIHKNSDIFFFEGRNPFYNKNVFATEKQAKSALAMAQISQIMEHDERFGGVVTDEEWNKQINKYVIRRIEDTYDFYIYRSNYQFLAFHTTEQRDLFVEENEQLIKDYLMLD